MDEEAGSRFYFRDPYPYSVSSAKSREGDGSRDGSVSIGRPQQKIPGIAYKLRRSDPDSPTYGHHYTKDQIRDLFSPTDESILRVRQWLVASGIPEGKISVSQTKSWVNFEASIGRLEQLLNAKYHVYDNLETRTEHFGTDEYYLPEDLAAHIDFVLPGTAFSRFHQGGVDLKKRKLGRTGTKSRPLRPPPAEIQSRPG